jgi:diguanylate cyclase
LASAEFDIARQRGDAVIALLERAEVAPVPAMYELAYNYVAGADTVGVSRFRGLLDLPSDERGRQLYEEFIRPYEPGETLELAIAHTVERLVTLDAMIVERWNLSRLQSTSLADTSRELAAMAPSPKLMREWIGRLETANQQAHVANERLNVELDRVREEHNSAQDEIAALRRDAMVDQLTGTANREGVDRALAAGLAPGVPRKTFAIAVVDVDHFKRFNDTYGHQAGDSVLRQVAKALLATSRVNDVVGRIGGDEFVVVFPDTAAAGARVVAEAIRRAVIEIDLSRALGTRVLGNLTVSIGIANACEGDTITKLVGRADGCLFEAKTAGRNCVVADDLKGVAAAMSKAG